MHLTDAENYCGNCGMDYNGISIAKLREIMTRSQCPECRQLLAEAEAMLAKTGYEAAETCVIDVLNSDD